MGRILNNNIISSNVFDFSRILKKCVKSLENKGYRYNFQFLDETSKTAGVGSWEEPPVCDATATADQQAANRPLDLTPSLLN